MGDCDEEGARAVLGEIDPSDQPKPRNRRASKNGTDIRKDDSSRYSGIVKASFQTSEVSFHNIIFSSGSGKYSSG